MRKRKSPLTPKLLALTLATFGIAGWTGGMVAAEIAGNLYMIGFYFFATPFCQVSRLGRMEASFFFR